MLNDHTLEIRNIKPSDGGDYACKISVLGDPIEIRHTLEILCKSLFSVLFYVSYNLKVSTYILVKLKSNLDKWDKY